MKKWFYGALTVGLALGATAAEAPKMNGGIRQNSEVIRSVDDSWSRAHGTAFWYENTGTPTTKVLKARFRHDGTTMKVKLTESKLERELKSTPDAISGDCWELHFAVRNDRGPLLVLRVTPDGAVQAAEWTRRKGGMTTGESKVLAPFATATSEVQAGVWSVELGFPLAALAPDGVYNAPVVYMNLFRVDGASGAVQAWNPTFAAKRDLPWRLGRLTLLP